MKYRSLLITLALFAAVPAASADIANRIDKAHTVATLAYISVEEERALDNADVQLAQNEVQGVTPAPNPAPVENVVTNDDVTTVPTPVEQEVAEMPETTKVTWAWGEWVEQLADTVFSLLSVAVLGLASMLPSHILGILKLARYEQIVANAAAYGRNVVVDMSKGGSMSFEVGNAALAEALNYFLKNAPAWVIKWAGGATAIAEKIWARFDIEPAAGKPDFELIAAQAQMASK